MGDRSDYNALQTMTPDFRVLMVDDNEKDRDALRFLLGDHPEAKIVGEASSVDAAAILCGDLQPNLILLDVEMPGGDGFSLLDKLDYAPAVIFVTGFDKFAIRAFEVNAIDYLIKPINPTRLKESLNRVLYSERPVEVGALKPTDRVLLRDDSRRRLVYVPQISGIKAYRNYNEVFLSDGTTVCVRDTMSNWEFRLPKNLFACPHRSFIVNVQAVHDVVLTLTGQVSFRLEGHESVFAFGREAGSALRKALKASRQS